MVVCSCQERIGGVKMVIDTLKIETTLAEQGLTKKEFAKKCGVSRQNISTIVRRGTCEPKTAGKIAAGLGVNISDLVSGNT